MSSPLLLLQDGVRGLGPARFCLRRGHFFFPTREAGKDSRRPRRKGYIKQQQAEGALLLLCSSTIRKYHCSLRDIKPKGCRHFHHHHTAYMHMIVTMMTRIFCAPGSELLSRGLLIGMLCRTCLCSGTAPSLHPLANPRSHLPGTRYSIRRRTVSCINRPICNISDACRFAAQEFRVLCALRGPFLDASFSCFLFFRYRTRVPRPHPGRACVGAEVRQTVETSVCVSPLQYGTTISEGGVKNKFLLLCI